MFTAKAVKRIRASQKLGTQIPMIQIIRVTLSKIPFFRITEIADRMTVNKITHAIAMTMTVQVTGRAAFMFSITGCLFVMAVPRSPVATPVM